MSPVSLIFGLLLCYAALTVAVFAVLAPRPPRLSADRRGDGTSGTSRLTLLTARTTAWIEAMLARRRQAPALAGAIEGAGLKIRPADLVVLTAAGAAAGAAVGLLLAGPVPALLLALAAPVAARGVLGVLAGRRRAAFAAQLDDSLQLLASGLRGGHSLLRAVDAVSAASPAPTSEEFARIINETRLGRDLGDSLHEAARRMGSQDFEWVAQAIAIHREVGGNLAEVLDGVSHTIRERGQIRGQVKALSAEGRISALVLMVLPFGLSGLLLAINPGHMTLFIKSPLGFLLMGIAGVLLLVGGLWLRKVVSFKF